MIRASAPGKLMIAGEYSVLSGGPALVTAVPRRARAVLHGLDAERNGSGDDTHGSPENPPLPREALLARALAEEMLGPTTGAMSIDVSDLRRSGRKLGLGSSAAAAGAAAALVFGAHGEDPATPLARGRVLDIALQAHRAVSPRGSGADVAAAVLGGTLSFRRDGARHETTAIDWPASIVMRVVWTGADARTSELVAEVEALEKDRPAEHAAAIGRIREAAAALVAAFRAERPDAVVEAARAHGDAMAALGEAAGAPIVEERLAAIARLAHAHGGASKPSGAGGGDVALAFFRDEPSAEGFAAECAHAGFDILSLAPGAEGVRLDS